MAYIIGLLRDGEINLSIKELPLLCLTVDEVKELKDFLEARMAGVIEGHPHVLDILLAAKKLEELLDS